MIVDKKRDWKYNTQSYEDTEEKTDYLDIWRMNPSYKDINPFRIFFQFSFICTLVLMIYILTAILLPNSYLALGIAMFSLIFCLIAFSDTLFFTQYSRTLSIDKPIPIKPFDNFAFWMLKQDTKTVLILNKKDALTIALRMFKIKILPENVYPTLNQFLKATYSANLPFSYQVVQKPKIKLSEYQHQTNYKAIQKEHTRLNTVKSFKTSIYFSVYVNCKGVLNKSRIEQLFEDVKHFSNTFESHISSNFHHTKVKRLKGKKLINGLRTYFSQHSVKTYQKPDDLSQDKEKDRKTILKLSFLISFLSYLSIIMVLLNVSFIVVIIIDLVIFIIIIILMWREIISHFSNSTLKRIDGAILFDPFYDVEFYRLKRINDTLFMYIDKQLLLAFKMVNLRNAIQPSLTYPDKVFRELIKHNMAFSYSLISTPATDRQSFKEYTKGFNEKTKEDLQGIIYRRLDDEDMRKYKHPDAEYKQWLMMRSGIWKTTLTLSVFAYKLTDDASGEDCYKLENKALGKIDILKSAFEDNFINYYLEPLKTQLLISGIQSNILRNASFRLNGSHLNYLYFQGKTLMELAKVVSEFKKGVEARIGAEFLTPLHLKNFITIGNTINTEFLEKEIPAGFTLNQIKSLLITNGIAEDREKLMMKIVAELTKVNNPCLIFDFSGNWSKLLRIFSEPPYNDKFLYFTLGQSFNLNLISSGIKYDQNNIEYLNYFYDVFALTFKEQKGVIDLLKKAIRENSQLTYNSMALDMQVKPEWEKNFRSENLINLLKEIENQSVFFSDKALEYDNDISPLDFIKTNKTVIIDLSLLIDLEQQIFATFLILSKFVHYLNYSNEYHKKIIFIPNVDLFFEQYYIDHNTAVHYGKINKFLTPLLQRGFGLIFSANQIHYLHSNLFNYIRNIITFQATDSRDMAVLKNVMHLQELQGSGYYSTKRKNTYQIDYLMTMRNNEIIVKREDINQPFPVKIKSKELNKTLPLSDEIIQKYMKNQGYDLKTSEQKLLAKLKDTLFEKDFGIYSEFIQDAKKFLDAHKIVDKIGNLTKNLVKKELLKFIYPRASKKTQNKKKIKALRDDLFDLLVKHGYLIETHPKMAGGGEALLPSYAVGQKYQIALEDEIQHKKNEPIKYKVEVIEQNNKENINIFEETNNQTNQKNFWNEGFREILAEQRNDLYLNLFTIYKLNNKREFEQSLDIGRDFIQKFFIKLYNSCTKNNNEIKSKFKDTNSFVLDLINNNRIPFTRTDLEDYLKNTQQIISDNANMEDKAFSVFKLVSNFFDVLDQYVNQT